MCNFKLNNNNNTIILRQDSLLNGIKPIKSEKELYLMKMHNNNRLIKSNTKG